MKDSQAYFPEGYPFTVTQENFWPQRQIIGVQTMGAHGNP
jgi:hypothetical protein